MTWLAVEVEVRGEVVPEVGVCLCHKMQVEEDLVEAVFLNDWETSDMKAAIDEFNQELQVRLLLSSSGFLDLSRDDW